MEAPQQTLPRMEPGHVSDQKLPRVEGVGVHDDVATSEYPKYIDHPTRGLTLAHDADHEAMLREEIANLPPAPPPTEEELVKAEMEKMLGRPVTDAEWKFSQDIGLVSSLHRPTTVLADLSAASYPGAAVPGTTFYGNDSWPPTPPLYPVQPQDVSTVVEYETKAYADGSSATGIAPLPDVSPEGAPVVETVTEPAKPAE